eukprot:1139646-Pelagomonas_calceolata.AAC.2
MPAPAKAPQPLICSLSNGAISLCTGLLVCSSSATGQGVHSYLAAHHDGTVGVWDEAQQQGSSQWAVDSSAPGSSSWVGGVADQVAGVQGEAAAAAAAALSVPGSGRSPSPAPPAPAPAAGAASHRHSRVRLVKGKGGKVRVRRLPIKRGTRGKGRGNRSGNRRRVLSSGARSGVGSRSGNGKGKEGGAQHQQGWQLPGRCKSVVDMLIKLAAVAQ